MDLQPIRKYQRLLIASCLALLTAVAYLPLLGNGFINIDDPLYVTSNPIVQDGLTPAGLAWAFTAFHAYNWHPLTWLSHMLDVELYGLRPWGHHLTSLALHAVNALLLFLFLDTLSRRRWASLCVALLFALHPLRVESVAWVAERKDVLSGVFFFLALWCYARHRAAPSRWRYAALLGSFILGLLAKPMLVTLPLLLLMLDRWPLVAPAQPPATILPWRTRIFELAPLLVLAGASCVMTMLAQYTGGAVVYESPLLLSAGNALISYLRYLSKLLWPVDLAVIYPFDPDAVTVTRVALALALLAGLSLLALWQRQRRPYLALGWFWYLITLLPVIGFVRIGRHAIADRYTYLPQVGLLILLVWLAAEFVDHLKIPRWATATAMAGVLTLMTTLTIQQQRRWQSSVTLLEHTLAVTGDNALAHRNLGVAYAGIGDLERAEREGKLGRMLENREVARLHPGNAEVRYKLALSYNDLGRYEEAVAELREALRLQPDFTAAWNDFGIALAGLGRRKEAISAFREALRLDPNYSKAQNNLRIMTGKGN